MIEESIVGLKRYHQEATLTLDTAVQKLKVVIQAGKELKRQHQEAMLEFNAAVQQQHQEAKEEFNTVMQLTKATTSANMNSLEGEDYHQPAVPEEVDTCSSSPTRYVSSVQSKIFKTSSPEV